MRLPYGWSQERDPDGNLMFRNDGENITTDRHPLLTHIRNQFQTIIESETGEKGSNSKPKNKISFKKLMQGISKPRTKQAKNDNIELKWTKNDPKMT